ncbi:MAG: hypothetical protein UD273_11160, partial [Gemmiger sp.]
LAVCSDAFCAMVSDGRFVEEPITGDKPHVIKNDLPKVRKINRNVMVGFAGDTLAAVQIINAVDEYQPQYLTLEKIVKIMREKAATVQVQPVGVRLIVGGRNRKGQFVMTMMGSADGYEPQTQEGRPGAYLIEGACSHTDVGPWLEEEVKPQAASWRSLDDVARTLDGCIAKMAKNDKSINTTYFRQLIR